eukprot:15459241-Alexandrium_andersonii.AAC.1
MTQSSTSGSNTSRSLRFTSWRSSGARRFAKRCALLASNPTLAHAALFRNQRHDVSERTQQCFAKPSLPAFEQSK